MSLISLMSLTSDDWCVRPSATSTLRDMSLMSRNVASLRPPQQGKTPWKPADVASEGCRLQLCMSLAVYRPHTLAAKGFRH
jgi:hypothetical protein